MKQTIEPPDDDEARARLTAHHVDLDAHHVELPNNERPQPTRHQRRAQAALNKRYRKRANAHSCVLHRECTAAGVRIHLEDMSLLHGFHVARGEGTCPACPVCMQCDARGMKVPTLNAKERVEVLDAWKELLEEAKRGKAPRDERNDDDQP